MQPARYEAAERAGAVLYAPSSTRDEPPDGSQGSLGVAVPGAWVWQ